MENKTCSKCGSQYLAKFIKRFTTKSGYPGSALYRMADGTAVYNNTCKSCHDANRKDQLVRQKAKRRERRKHWLESSLKEKTSLSKLKCRNCGRESRVTYVKSLDYSSPPYRHIIHFYRDESDGTTWRGERCGRCHLDYVRKKRGHSERDKSTKKQVVNAVWAEKKAAEKFMQLGFDVQRNKKATGPDLVCKLGPLEYTVEVKRATYSSQSWRVGTVRKARKSDDLVAIVLPNGSTYIDSMEHHLSKCSKHGQRRVTDIVKMLCFDES